MAIKKNELYSSLWASCDKLRGGMDASQYKDYILTLLFVKYVTDKYKDAGIYAEITVFDKAHDPEPEMEKRVGCSFDDMVALKGNANIGEGLDKIVSRLAEVNTTLKGVIENAHFNDEEKLGKGKEMVDKLTGLISIFQRPEFDFTNNKAGGDDILGDAYEYLMRKFATESGKSKGQFYTPAEVSRILAKVVGIDKVTGNRDWSVYDPACGSGSLLIKAADEAPEGVTISIYGQEKEITTAGLAKMNLVLHNKADGEIEGGYSTFSNPRYLKENEEELRQFDFIVANPPFSLKNWTDGLKEFGRFDGYEDRPPEKNGDFAWLLHIIKSLKRTGKAAVILPHGVLFRGNAEETLRKNIIDRGYIKGIIGLPANLFYGTGIPACIIIIDKEDADDRKGIFMIDASHDFVKDGNKNRLREQDIKKIVTTFNEQIVSDKHYARFVPNDEIKTKNNYNLNIPRYIESGIKEDEQNIDAHLHGGIPKADIDSMDKYWSIFPKLKDKLFSIFREGFYKLNIEKDQVRSTIYGDEEFSCYAQKIDDAFDKWMQKVNDSLNNIKPEVDVKEYIVWLSDCLLKEYENIELVDKYDVYQVLLAYWQEVMADDVFLIKYDGYETGRELAYEYATKKEKKDGQTIEVLTDKVKSWDGKLIPRTLVEKEFFNKEKDAIEKAQMIAEETQAKLDEYIEENSAEDCALSDYYDADKNSFDDKKAMADYKKQKKAVCKTEDFVVLEKYATLSETLKKQNKIVKELVQAFDLMVKEKYSVLTIEEIKELLVNKKWYYTIFDGIKSLYATTSHNIANRIVELVERYENTLPSLETEIGELEKKVKAHLAKMGFNW